MRRARGTRRASGVAMPDLDPEGLLSRAAGAQPVATGLLPAAWLSAVLLCAPPAAAAEDRADWRPAAGGPLHPLQPVVEGAAFPLGCTLAVHVRVQGRGRP